MTGLDGELVGEYREAMVPRLQEIRDRIEAHADGPVTLVAVSKAQPIEAVAAALSLGLTAFGENYAQELAAKHAIIAADRIDAPAATDPEWHFIGQLQTNKVRQIADIVSCWQSVDRLKVGREIAKRAPGAAVYAQVNLSGDPGKAGCDHDKVEPLVESLIELGLRVQGLMGVGTAADDAATTAGFVRLVETADRLGLAVRSMGMSADLDLALTAGSTMVRVGSALFGPRTARSPR